MNSYKLNCDDYFHKQVFVVFKEFWIYFFLTKTMKIGYHYKVIQYFQYNIQFTKTIPNIYVDLYSLRNPNKTVKKYLSRNSIV